MRQVRLAVWILSGLVMLPAGSASAQAPSPGPTAASKPGASTSAELGVVVVTGNATATSVGLRNVFTYRWPETLLVWEAGWVQAASQDGSRYAVVDGAGAFAVVDPETRIDSQRLFSKLRYQQQISSRHDWFANFDTVRDEPSNINRQFVLAGGLGTTWRKTDSLTFRTAYGFTYTDEDLVVEDGNHFGGYRLFYGLKALPADRTTIESELTADGSFDASDDIRADWLNGVSVALNSSMALKSSLRVLFRNLPALEEVPLRTLVGAPAGTVEVPKDKIDTNLTTSLVITF